MELKLLVSYISSTVALISSHGMPSMITPMILTRWKIISYLLLSQVSSL